MKYLISMSGGKDSTACLLWALETLPKEDVIPYYLDTKWEHDAVYEYLDYLEDKLDITIKRIESEGMAELSKRKKMMPNKIMRFCTENLKVIPALEFYYSNFVSKNIDFINITGVRRDESEKRANTESFMVKKEIVNGIEFDVKTLHPIAYWDTQRVFDFHKAHGVEVNPLYKKGFTRVGCYPCIYARKHEMQMMEPKYIKRLRDLEKQIGAKFFAPDRDKYLRETLDFGEDYEMQCVNQYGICE